MLLPPVGLLQGLLPVLGTPALNPPLCLVKSCSSGDPAGPSVSPEKSSPPPALFMAFIIICNYMFPCEAVSLLSSPCMKGPGEQGQYVLITPMFSASSVVPHPSRISINTL